MWREQQKQRGAVRHSVGIKGETTAIQAALLLQTCNKQTCIPDYLSVPDHHDKTSDICGPCVCDLAH